MTIITSDMLRAIAVQVHGKPQGALPALARLIGISERTVRRWASGREPVPAELQGLIIEKCAVHMAPEADWIRDEWIIGKGMSREDDLPRREYVIHAAPPRFTCRVVAIDPDTDDALDLEEPADTMNGITYNAGDGLLCEFVWIDSPPHGDRLVQLLKEAETALARGDFDDLVEEMTIRDEVWSQAYGDAGMAIDDFEADPEEEPDGMDSA